MFTAACYEHRPIIGSSAERLADFEDTLLSVTGVASEKIHAWVVLPNHYHLLVSVDDVARGRKVWFSAAETVMKSERHFWATMNYLHHNPVRHGLVESWQEWPFSSASQFLDSYGREDAERLWREYPVKDFGAGWDE